MIVHIPEKEKTLGRFRSPPRVLVLVLLLLQSIDQQKLDCEDCLPPSMNWYAMSSSSPNNELVVSVA